VYSKTSFKPNESRVVAFTANKGDRDATASEFLYALVGTNLPDTLARSLGTGVTLTVEGKSISDPLIGYLSLTSRSPANTLAGLIEWEGTLGGDLIPLLDPIFPRGRLLELRDRSWGSKRILGVDVRILTDIDKRVVIAYAVVNKNQLFIAGNDTVLAAAISKYQDKNK
jgi:hypothetical protein